VGNPEKQDETTVIIVSVSLDVIVRLLCERYARKKRAK
jgi:hypothetical protein